MEEAQHLVIVALQIDAMSMLVEMPGGEVCVSEQIRLRLAWYGVLRKQRMFFASDSPWSWHFRSWHCRISDEITKFTNPYRAMGQS